MKIIGIDLGGTMVKGALFVDGKMLRSSKRPSFGSVSQEKIMQALDEEISSLMEKGVSSIGIASAGVIDPINGVCLSASSNLQGWGGTRIAEEVSKRFSVPVKVENDAIAALIGERSVQPEKNNITLLTFGTGVGGASIINGKIDRAKATYWGHRVIVENGKLCNCGQKGCAEAYLSAVALLKEAKSLDPSFKSTFDIMERYKKGEEAAKSVVRSYGYHLSLLLTLIKNEISPKKIILGGGLMEAKDVISTLIPSSLYDLVEFAKLRNLAGVRGAYIIASNEKGVNI